MNAPVSTSSKPLLQATSDEYSAELSIESDLRLSTVKEHSSLPLSIVKEPSSLPSLPLSNIKEPSLPSTIPLSLPSSSSIDTNINIHDNNTIPTDISICIINTIKNPDHRLIGTSTSPINSELPSSSASSTTLNDNIQENIDINFENIHNNGIKDAHENINSKPNVDTCNASIDNDPFVIIDTNEGIFTSLKKTPIFKEMIPISNEIVPNSDKKMINSDEKIPKSDNNNDNNNTKNKVNTNSKHNDNIKNDSIHSNNNRRYNDEKGIRIFGFIEKINEKRKRDNHDSRIGSNNKITINSDVFEDVSKQFDTSSSDLSIDGTEIRVSDMDIRCTGAQITTDDLNDDRVLIEGLGSVSQKRKHSETDNDDFNNNDTKQNKLINSNRNNEANVDDCIEKTKNKTENDENNDNNSESFTDTENNEKIDGREEIEEKVDILKDDNNDTNCSFTTSNLLKIIKIKKSPENKDKNIGIKEIKNISNYFYTLSDDNQTKVIANIIKNRKHNPNMKRITPTFLVPLSMREKYLELLYFTNNIN
jgi:hypothetical protein